MRQSTGAIVALSLRANGVSEAILTEIASSPSAPRNDRAGIPPFTDRLQKRGQITSVETNLSKILPSSKKREVWLK